MFELFRNYKCEEPISLKEVIDQYADKYYLDVMYKPNGNVEIFIGSNKTNLEIEKNAMDIDLHKQG